eukprot:4775019-Prymnesium_polylepis.1
MSECDGLLSGLMGERACGRIERRELRSKPDFPVRDDVEPISYTTHGAPQYLHGGAGCSSCYGARRGAGCGHCASRYYSSSPNRRK